MDADRVDDSPDAGSSEPSATAHAEFDPASDIDGATMVVDAPDGDNLPAPRPGARSVPLDHAIVRALSTGAAPGSVIEQAANAVRVLCPDRGVAVWYRSPNGTATVQAAGLRGHLVMIAGDADSRFWDQARTEERPNYDITFRAHPDDVAPISVWCIPITDGPVVGDLTLVVVGSDDGTPPDGDVQTGLEQIVRLIGVSLDRKRLVERLEDIQNGPDERGPEVEMGLVPTGGGTTEPAGTVLLYVRLAQIRDFEHFHGRKASEELIEEVGRRLSRTVRPGDTIARLSDTEYALRCYRVNAIQAESIASRVLNNLWAPVVTRWEETRLRPRIGLSRAVEPTPLSRLLSDADTAMRKADSVGRDWLWDSDEVEQKPAEPGPAPVGNGFGSGGAEPPTEPEPPQSEPGRLADSASGSPE